MLKQKQICVNVSTFLPLVWNQRSGEECRTELIQKCEERKENVCGDVTETICEIVPFTECKLTVTEQKIKESSLVPRTFIEKECVQSKRNIPHRKLMPECTNVTKQQCDSKWVINAHGEKVFDDHVNCRDVTWENCKLVPTPIEEEVETYDCVDAQDPITYETVEKRQDWVSLKRTTCKAVAKPVCEVSTKTVCEDVEIHNCQDVIVPNCFPVEFRIPYQEYNHLLRCPIKH